MTTTTTTPWAHLPNAVHIDRVIVSAKANPNQWAKAWWAIHHPAWDHEQRVAWDAVRADIKKQGWITAVYALSAAGYAVQGAFIALVAYDDCAYMLDSDPGELAILAKFGDPRAVLILPACEILHSLKESVV
jgi:hypothetical protein